MLKYLLNNDLEENLKQSGLTIDTSNDKNIDTDIHRRGSALTLGERIHLITPECKHTVGAAVQCGSIFM